MRDRRFVAVHRGGSLDEAKHRLLAAWAADCADHVLPLFEECRADDRPRRAIETAKAWARGAVSVGVAQKALSRTWPGLTPGMSSSVCSNPARSNRSWPRPSRWPKRLMLCVTWLRAALSAGSSSQSDKL